MPKEKPVPPEENVARVGNELRLGKALCSNFSERELEVLGQLVSGASNSTIAGRMNLSVDTVKYHLKNLLSKTGCQTRTELAVKACLCGILPPENTESF